ncbi:MAG TPA: hypothetical protein VM260_24510 [Pirellula sp.]|nr:hypothetical protein [Pirellula sp.]
MRKLAPLLQQQTRSDEIDSAIGQIDLIGESGEIVKSWKIRSPKCTIGSSLDCSVQLTSFGIAPLHATLIFGKKHTLLRSSGPTLISNRHVREWLIDHSTEIVIGQSRLVVHPSLGVLATVVRADNLIDHAARLCNELAPLIQEPAKPSVPKSNAPNPNASMNSIDASIQSPTPPAVDSKLDSIERLLQSLQVSLDKIQESFGTETKNANESIVESVSHGIDEFGKRLFTTLNDQLSNQTGVQQSLIANLAERFTDRFGAIDDQLSRFNDANSLQTNSLSELLAQAKSEKEFFEARFQEVASHRGELIDAVQVLRSEIAIAFQTPNIPTQQAAFVLGSHSENLPESNVETRTSVTDSQLAESLERAQIQIQELNHQLRTLETERDSAQQRVASLSESWLTVQAASEKSEPPNYASAPNVSIEYLEAPYAEATNAEAPYAEAPYNESPNSDFTNSEVLFVEPAAAENLDEDLLQPGPHNRANQLPTWFTMDEPVASRTESAEPLNGQIETSSPVEPVQQFAIPDLSSYSDAGYEPEPFERSEHLEHASENKVDSVSDRLQRMLMDANQRRGTVNPPTSLSWSQKHNKSSAEGQQASKLNRLQHAFQAESLPLDLDDLDESTENDRQKSAPASFLEKQFSPAELDGESPVSKEQNQRDRDPFEESEIDADEVQDVSQSNNRLTQDESPQENGPGAVEEDSIEQYMQRLLCRVRGGSESEEATGPTTLKTSAQTAVISSRNNTRPRVEAFNSPAPNDSEAQQEALKLDEELFAPRQQAPEQRNDLAALRELANTNARRAINRSDIRRTNSAFLVKLGVTAMAVSSAVALFLFNGFSLNAPFVGMVAAIIVSLLWGYDSINHFNRMKKAGGKNQVTAAETAAGQSIQVGSDEDSGWRPTPG